MTANTVDDLVQQRALSNSLTERFDYFSFSF